MVSRLLITVTNLLDAEVDLLHEVDQASEKFAKCDCKNSNAKAVAEPDPSCEDGNTVQHLSDGKCKTADKDAGKYADQDKQKRCKQIPDSVSCPSEKLV